MSAQLIVIPLPSNVADAEADRPLGDESPGSSAAGSGTGLSSPSPGDGGKPLGTLPNIPKWPGPLPIGTVKIFGQTPNHFGEFDSFPKLFQELHKAGVLQKLPGASNTVFATVKDLSELGKPSLGHALAQLPSELTIIVRAMLK